MLLLTVFASPHEDTTRVPEVLRKWKTWTKLKSGPRMSIQSGFSHLRIESMVEDNRAHAGTIKSQIPAWFERKFDFNFPVEEHPILCVRLRGTPARLEEMLREVSREVLLSKPDGRWSAQEHAGHLLDLESLWMDRVDDFLTSKETLTIADLSNRKTNEANHNSWELIEILAEFRTTRLRLMDHIGKFQPALFARLKLHPRLKQPMRLVVLRYKVQMIHDHHLAKIWEMVDPSCQKAT